MITVADRTLFRQNFLQAVQELSAHGSSSFMVPLADGTEVALRLSTQEENVPTYTLPDPLALPNGDRVRDAATWLAQQRPRLLEIFQNEVYGRTPAFPLKITFEPLSYAADALDARAIRKEVRVWFQGEQYRTHMDILIYLPRQAQSAPVPLFVGLNFQGNHTIHPDPAIRLSTQWVADNLANRARDDQTMADRIVVDNRATEKARGVSASRWPVEKIIGRGYGLATIYCGDLDPDFDDGFQNGVHPLGYEAGETRPHANQWGAIAAWAWGLQRAMDYFESDEQIDAKRVAVLGHSRLGKTALWAAAQDERFAAVISNNSGCMGAALTAREFGETLAAINLNFPHWFCENCKRYIAQPHELAVDQHMLLTLIAPRPLYVASAEQDRWADPRGEFLALKEAESVYALFGKTGLGSDQWPALHTPLLGAQEAGGMGYHIRAGAHDITDYDWEQFLNFADRSMTN